VNSTLRSLLFWMVLVVVGVLIWNFSATFQTRDKTVTFSEFVKQLDEGQVQKIVLTGNEILGTTKAGEKFRTYAPPSTRARQQAHRAQRRGDGQGAHHQPVGDAALRLGADPADDRLLDLLHAADAERGQQGPQLGKSRAEAVEQLRRRR